MDKLKLFSISLLFMSLYACKPSDVDGITKGDFSYYIHNTTERRVGIVYQPLSHDLDGENFDIPANDSIKIEGRAEDFGDPVPFPLGNVYVIFDDTVKYKCEDNPEGRCMLNRYFRYSSIEVSKDVYKRDYYITEEDYEYAKAHPYEETTE